MMMSQLGKNGRRILSASVGGIVAAIWLLNIADPAAHEECDCADTPSAETSDGQVDQRRQTGESTGRSDQMQPRRPLPVVAQSVQTDIEPPEGSAAAHPPVDHDIDLLADGLQSDGLLRRAIHAAWGPPLYRLAPSNSPPLPSMTPRQTPLGRG